MKTAGHIKSLHFYGKLTWAALMDFKRVPCLYPCYWPLMLKTAWMCMQQHDWIIAHIHILICTKPLFQCTKISFFCVPAHIFIVNEYKNV